MGGEHNFLKSKMHFTLGLLGALFALHPFYPKFDALSFVYMGATIPVSYALITFGVLLAGATYFFAAGLTQEHPSGLGQKAGNLLYSMAVMTVPLYAGLYLTTVVENYLDFKDYVSDARLKSPLVTFGLLSFWIAAWAIGAYAMRHFMSKRDWVSKIDSLIDTEFEAVKRAKEMLSHEHFDLCIIQCERAVLARLKMACLKVGVSTKKVRSAQAAVKAGIITPECGQLADLIFKNVAVARSTVPSTDSQAHNTMSATKKLLSSTKV